MGLPIRPELAGHPDSTRWNARYTGDFVPAFAAHPLAEQALGLPLPGGPVLDLACGPSGSALLAAAIGRPVTAVDVSSAALTLLAQESARRGLTGLITLVHADLSEWRPPPPGFALVLCTGYWDRGLFPTAAAAVTPGGLLAWEAFTTDAQIERPHLPAAWCLGPGEPATLLPPGYEVISQSNTEPPGKRRMLARRRRPGG